MALWNPTEIATDLWLDAADNSTITIDSGVQIWSDKSGNGRDAVQALGANQPTVANSWLNGLDSISFSGSGQYLSCGDVLDLGTAGKTVVAVAQVNNTGNLSGVVYAKALAAATAGRFSLNWLLTVNKLSGMYIVGTTAENTNEVAYTSVASNVLSQVIDRSGTQKIGVNGTQTEFSVTANYTDFNTATRFLIGAYSNATDTGLYASHNGHISEILVFDRVLQVDELQTVEGYLAWKWGLEANLPVGHPYKNSAPLMGILISVIRQLYDLEDAVFLSVLRQEYNIIEEYMSKLGQLYGESFISILTQPYSDKNLLLSTLAQQYKDKNLLLSTLTQKYRDKNKLSSTLRQSYDLRESLLSRVVQTYAINKLVGVGLLRQGYDLNNIETLLSTLTQRYSLAHESINAGSVPSSITIGGADVDVMALDITYDIDTYCGVFNLELKEAGPNDLDEVIITLDGVDHRSIVTSRSTDESHGQRSFKIESRSPAILLDYPYAKKIFEDFVVSGKSSQVVNDIALLEGFSINWHMDSDPPQTSSTFEVSGEYPLQAIRNLVNELGGKIQSHPDGSIHAIKRQPVNSDKYDTSAIESTLSTVNDFETIATDSDQRSGNNSFTVSSESIDNDYSLSIEKVSESNAIVKAHKVPWVSSYVELVTSELTNISIEELGVITETITQEDVEIIEGVGAVDLPCYGSVVYDYGTRTDLGLLTISESGEVSTAVPGNTLVNVTYQDKHWAWDVIDTDPETVQFILFTVI